MSTTAVSERSEAAPRTTRKGSRSEENSAQRTALKDRNALPTMDIPKKNLKSRILSSLSEAPGAAATLKASLRSQETNTLVSVASPIPSDPKTVKRWLLDDAPGEDYWRCVAEERRRGLAEALEENEVLVAECEAKATRIAELEGELGRMGEELGGWKRLAEDGQRYADILREVLDAPDDDDDGGADETAEEDEKKDKENYNDDDKENRNPNCPN